jgi:arylformamidase
MVGNTGTYLDSPFHRFAGAADLASLPLPAVADLPALVVDARDRRAIGADLLAERLGGQRISGCAVLLHTGGDSGLGTPAYAHEAPYLTADGADWLSDREPALVGIDVRAYAVIEDEA